VPNRKRQQKGRSMNGKLHVITNTEPPPFLFKIKEALAKFWQSLGGTSMKVSQASDLGYEIMLFPAVRETYGGKEDGELYFPGFSLNVARFAQVFDREPAVEMIFDCLSRDVVDHFLFQGTIDGIAVKVAILAGPPSGQTPVERMYVQGSQAGTVKRIEESD
jgi:hypothetical protein